jgi:hypothetical protein
MPGRSSTSSALKRPPRAKAQVDLHLIEHEELGVGSAFGRAALDDDGIRCTHGSPPRKMAESNRNLSVHLALYKFRIQSRINVEVHEQMWR